MRKLNVRIEKFNRYGYDKMRFQLFTHPYKNSDMIDCIGEIYWQRNNADDSWYGLSFEVSTNKVEHLAKMLTLAKKVNELGYDVQPSEVFNELGLIEYEVKDQNFVKVESENLTFRTVEI
jgi:hypothetical protein